MPYKKEKRPGRKPLFDGTKLVTTSISLKPEILEWLDIICKVNNRSRNNMINQILEQHKEMGTDVEFSGLGAITLPSSKERTYGNKETNN